MATPFKIPSDKLGACVDPSNITLYFPQPDCGRPSIPDAFQIEDQCFQRDGMIELRSCTAPGRFHACLCQLSHSESQIAVTIRSNLSIQKELREDRPAIVSRFLSDVRYLPLFPSQEHDCMDVEIFPGGPKVKLPRYSKKTEISDALDLNNVARMLYASLKSAQPSDTKGLIIVCGETSARKTQVVTRLILFALLDQIKATSMRQHFISLEDPVEQYFTPPSGASEASWLIDATQRERSKSCQDVSSFASSALRQRPAVTSFGEVRSNDDWKSVLEFAATGHLCICTAHAASLTDMFTRLIRATYDDPKSEDFANLASRLAMVIHLKRFSDQNCVMASVWVGDPITRGAFTSGQLRSLIPSTIESNCFGYTECFRFLTKDVSEDLTTLKVKCQASDAGHSH